ncbi:unnamed protein product [Prorocentrum cordatum]|uniref:Uncharacterized protein n=1 Tax=Prorocentrum cordatum TaxID=2364126 RepID=A0ABN9Q203_9DINO|nr:unnamed protein product [Polarella glacialis]
MQPHARRVGPQILHRGAGRPRGPAGREGRQTNPGRQAARAEDGLLPLHRGRGAAAALSSRAAERAELLKPRSAPAWASGPRHRAPTAESSCGASGPDRDGGQAASPCPTVLGSGYLVGRHADVSPPASALSYRTGGGADQDGP